MITAVLLMHAYLLLTDLWTRNILITINNCKAPKLITTREIQLAVRKRLQEKEKCADKKLTSGQ